MVSIQECLLITAQSFHFFRRFEFFYPFHQFCNNRFQHSTHTHNSLRPAQKYLLKQRNWDTQSFTVYWINKRKEGEKKSLQIIFVCRQNAYLQICYSDRKRNHLPRDPLGAYARLYPWTWDAPQHLMFTVIQDNWQNKKCAL
jgi:hypothetical protein